MPTVKPSPGFTQWLLAASAHERRSVDHMMRALRRSGLMPKDPDLVEIHPAYRLGRSVPTEVALYVLPDLIQVAPGASRRHWFGISRGIAGTPPGVGLLIVLKAWTADPTSPLATRLTTQVELMRLADAVCP
jgi:hypothetical protein